MGRSRAIAGTVLSVCLASACTRANPAFDLEEGSEPWASSEPAEEATEATGGPDGGVETTGDSVGATAGGSGDPGDDADDAEPTGDTPDGDDDPALPEEPLDDRLLYSTLDSPQAVLAPSAGMGPGAVSMPAPELVTGALDGAMRFSQPGQWIAFPQRVGGVSNIDHRSGSLEVDVRFELTVGHVQPCDLFALSGVLEDGGGLRMGVAGLLDDNRVWVEYIDAQGFAYLTRFPAGTLPAGQWVHLTLAWRADVAEGEPNVSLWIDGEPIEPLPDFAAGPKEVGDPSDQDVILLGSWSLSGGYPAEASFDELQIFAGG